MFTIVVHEPDPFSVPKGGTNSSHVFCKDHTLKCSKGPLYKVAYRYKIMVIAWYIKDVLHRYRNHSIYV